MLSYDAYGDPSHPTLLIVHGLFGSGRNWRAIARRLSSTQHVVTVDMRNHGTSFWSEDMTYEAMAEDLAEISGHFGSPLTVLGHSMGGKAAMMLALSRPELVEKLIVADIAPVAYTHTQIPYIDAMEALDLSTVSKRSDADEGLLPLVDDPGLRAFFLQSLIFEEESARWSLNLKSLRANMPHILSFPDTTDIYEGPCLFVNGADSDYMTPQSKAVTRDRFPKARFVAIKNAGHWLHADQPRAFIQTIQAATRR